MDDQSDSIGVYVTCWGITETCSKKRSTRSDRGGVASE